MKNALLLPIERTSITVGAFGESDPVDTARVLSFSGLNFDSRAFGRSEVKLPPAISNESLYRVKYAMSLHSALEVRGGEYLTVDAESYLLR
jgi:hypothetical protein